MAKVKRQSVKLEFELDQGSTFRHQITWATGVEGAEEPVNLTGCTARAHIREEIDSATTLHEMTTENGGITLGGADGTIDLYISDEDTAGFDWTIGFYDLEIEFGNGDVRQLTYGTFTNYDEVTRPNV